MEAKPSAKKPIKQPPHVPEAKSLSGDNFVASLDLDPSTFGPARRYSPVTIERGLNLSNVPKKPALPYAQSISELRGLIKFDKYDQMTFDFNDLRKKVEDILRLAFGTVAPLYGEPDLSGLSDSSRINYV